MIIINYMKHTRISLRADHKRKMPFRDHRCSCSLGGIDLYAKPIRLTYGGKDKISSAFGGLVSIVVIMIAAICFIEGVINVHNGERS